jgi:hypothetical protein
MEFLDISLTKDSFAPCYSQSFPLADLKKTILYSGFNNPYEKIRKENSLFIYKILKYGKLRGETQSKTQV